jgi:hypothetical protein
MTLTPTLISRFMSDVSIMENYKGIRIFFKTGRFSWMKQNFTS